MGDFFKKMLNAILAPFSDTANADTSAAFVAAVYALLTFVLTSWLHGVVAKKNALPKVFLGYFALPFAAAQA